MIEEAEGRPLVVLPQSDNHGICVVDKDGSVEYQSFFERRIKNALWFAAGLGLALLAHEAQSATIDQKVTEGQGCQQAQTGSYTSQRQSGQYATPFCLQQEYW